MDLALVLLHVKEMHRHTRFEVEALLESTRDYNEDHDWFLDEEERRQEEQRQEEQREQTELWNRKEEQFLEKEREEEEERRILALEKFEIEVQRKRVKRAERELQEARAAESQLEEDAADEKRLRDIKYVVAARELSRRCFVDNRVVPWEDGAGLGPMSNMNPARCSGPSMSVRVSLVIPEALTFTF
jgi:hypothetical protein